MILGRAFFEEAWIDSSVSIIYETWEDRILSGLEGVGSTIIARRMKLKMWKGVSSPSKPTSLNFQGGPACRGIEGEGKEQEPKASHPHMTKA